MRTPCRNLCLVISLSLSLSDATMQKQERMKKLMMKMKTVDTASLASTRGKKGAAAAAAGAAGAASSSSPTKKSPSAYIDVTTDSLDRHRPGNLPGPAVYLDVEGVDNLQPAYMGECGHVVGDGP